MPGTATAHEPVSGIDGLFLGLLVASDLEIGWIGAVALGAPVGLFAGVASTPDPGPFWATVLTTAGAVVGANLVLFAVAIPVLLVRRRFARPCLAVGPRILGSWLAAMCALIAAMMVAYW